MFQYEYLYNHGFYTAKDYDHFIAVCALGFNSDECKEMRDKLDNLFDATRTPIINIYAPCYENPT